MFTPHCVKDSFLRERESLCLSVCLSDTCTRSWFITMKTCSLYIYHPHHPSAAPNNHHFYKSVCTEKFAPLPKHGISLQNYPYLMAWMGKSQFCTSQHFPVHVNGMPLKSNAPSFLQARNSSSYTPQQPVAVWHHHCLLPAKAFWTRPVIQCVLLAEICLEGSCTVAQRWGCLAWHPSCI